MGERGSGTWWEGGALKVEGGSARRRMSYDAGAHEAAATAAEAWKRAHPLGAGVAREERSGNIRPLQHCRSDRCYALRQRVGLDVG